MVTVFTHLRGMTRLFFICTVLLRQFVHFGPCRLLFGGGAKRRKLFGRYLSTAEPRMSPAEIVRETLQKLGPTYVKFGQFLSIRPDLVPPEFCEEFKKLQDRVPPVPFAMVRRELWNELKKDPAEVFS
jgi:ubiquinone biosynthesis protein